MVDVLQKHFTGKIKDLAENTTIQMANDIIILKPDDGYIITQAVALCKPYEGADTERVGAFTINKDSTASFVIPEQYKGSDDVLFLIRAETEENYDSDDETDLSDDPEINSVIHPETPPKQEIPPKAQPTTQPNKVIYVGDYKLTSYKDRLTLTYDNNNTFTITTNDNKYIINSVQAIYSGNFGDKKATFTNGIISADKHKYILKLKLTEDFDKVAFPKIRFTVDVADISPIKPVAENEHQTQRIYTVDDSGLNQFVRQGVEMLKGTNENYDYTSFVNQIYTLPFTLDMKLSEPVSKIATGLWSINANAREFKDIYATISCGTIKVIPEHGNGFDKSVKSVSLYLPFIPVINLDIDDCYNKDIYAEYVTNLMTGTTTVNVYSNNTLLKTFNAIIKNDMQLFNIYNNSDIGKISSTLKNKIKQAYIKIVYFEPVDNLDSYETLEHNKLSSYTNFVKTRNSTVSVGTQEEQLEIEMLLNKGIFINSLQEPQK